MYSPASPDSIAVIRSVSPIGVNRGSPGPMGSCSLGLYSAGEGGREGGREGERW